MRSGDNQSDFHSLLEAVRFAAEQHRTQYRKYVDRVPYINHPIAVASVLATYGGVTDLVTLMASYLHDTIEDTDVCGDELERKFGADVRRIVEEVSDDKSLPKEERKLRQISHALSLSHRAKQLKLADLTCNVEDVAVRPAVGWSLARRREYLDWAGKVGDGCRGVNAGLEARFDEVLADARREVGSA